MTTPVYSALLGAWGIDYAGLDEAAPIDGSPERTAARMVVRDVSGGRWILEAVRADQLDRKQQIAESLEELSALESILLYRRSVGGSFFQPADGKHWMLRVYQPGIPLDRRFWLEEDWRLDAMGDFLRRLRDASGGLQSEVFSVAEYVTGRMTAWRRRLPRLADSLERPFQTLETRFFPVLDSLPTSFCHGDFHPLNMVWGEKAIRSVIDWEFCGCKPELYDVALLLGCIGFDEPDHWLGAPAARLVRTLRGAGFGADVSWNCLMDLAVSIRFGWMSEWVRRGDEEAAEMEAFYMQLLMDQGAYIASVLLAV